MKDDFETLKDASYKVGQKYFGFDKLRLTKNRFKIFKGAKAPFLLSVNSLKAKLYFFVKKSFFFKFLLHPYMVWG